MKALRRQPAFHEAGTRIVAQRADPYHRRLQGTHRHDVDVCALYAKEQAARKPTAPQ